MFASADTFQGWSGNAIPFFGWGIPSTEEPVEYFRGGSVSISRPVGFIQAKVITGSVIKSFRLPKIDLNRQTRNIIRGIRKGLISFSMICPGISRGIRRSGVSKSIDKPFISMKRQTNISHSSDSNIIEPSKKKGTVE